MEKSLSNTWESDRQGEAGELTFGNFHSKTFIPNTLNGHYVCQALFSMLVQDMAINNTGYLTSKSLQLSNWGGDEVTKTYKRAITM